MQTKNLSGRRIKLARVNREMAQVDLCAALSVDHIERGIRFLPDIELAMFAAILNVNPLWLMYGDIPPTFSAIPLKS